MLFLKLKIQYMQYFHHYKKYVGYKGLQLCSFSWDSAEFYGKLLCSGFCNNLGIGKKSGAHRWIYLFLSTLGPLICKSKRPYVSVTWLKILASGIRIMRLCAPGVLHCSFPAWDLVGPLALRRAWRFTELSCVSWRQWQPRFFQVLLAFIWHLCCILSCLW